MTEPWQRHPTIPTIPLIQLSGCLALLLSACAGGDKPTRGYVPEQQPPSAPVAAAPEEHTPASPSPAAGVRGAAAVAAANRALVEPEGDQMRGAVWAVPEASCDLPYHLYVADRSVTTIAFPAGEAFSKIVPPNRDFYAYSVADTGDRVSVSISPQGRQARAALHVATDRCTYLFAVDTVPDSRALAGLELNRPTRRPRSATAAPVPDGGVTQLAMTPAGGSSPPWMPERAWSDALKTVVCFPPGPLPQLPVVAGGSRGEQAVSFHLVTDGDRQCLATYGRLTEFHLILPPDDVAVTAGAGGK